MSSLVILLFESYVCIRYPGDTFREGIKRHQHFMALQLGLKKGMKVSGEA